MINRKFLLCILLVTFPQFLMVGVSFSAIHIDTFTVSPSTISLPDQDPDLYPEVSSAVNLSVTTRISGMNKNQRWNLDIYSSQNLVSGGNSIPIGNVRWTVTGTDPSTTFYNANLSLNQYITTATNTGDTDQVIYFTFYLQNFWTYATGNYLTTITLRLTAPAGNVATNTFTLSLGLSGRAKLNFGILALNFPDSDPNSIPSIPANVNPVSVTASSRTGSSLTTTLNCVASGDLISGTSSIPISNLTWQSTGSGFIPGTMDKVTSQTAGSWTGSGVQTGTFSYFLNNSWSYNVGNYSTTIIYTLTAP